MCVVLFALFYFVPNILTLPSPQSTLLQFTALHVSGFASLSSSANQHCRRRNHIQATVVIVANAVAAITKFKSKLIVVCFYSHVNSSHTITASLFDATGAGVRLIIEEEGIGIKMESCRSGEVMIGGSEF